MQPSPRSYVWKTKSIIPETKESITIVFDTGAEKFNYKAGQFINLTVNIDDTPVTRSYSFSSSPDEHDSPSITVKKVYGGLLSTYIVDQAHHIKEWYIDGPYGSFTAPSGRKHLVLLGGGSGITPLFSILKDFLVQGEDMRVTLIYANRTPEDIIFKGAIEQWQKIYGERINVIHVLSQAVGQANNLPGTIIQTRLNKIIVKKLIRQAVISPSQQAYYLICGPVSLMSLYGDALVGMEISDDLILLEHFAPALPDQPIVLPDKTHEVLFHFYEQSNLLEVKPGSTILSSALAEKMPLPYSCKAGTCGRCVAKLTAGNVSMPNNFILRKNELDAGMILLCQSYPLNDQVTIEIG